MFVVVINLQSPYAFSPSSQSIIMLPTPVSRRDKPLVTVVGTNIIIHGKSEQSYEESLGIKSSNTVKHLSFLFLQTSQLLLRDGNPDLSRTLTEWSLLWLKSVETSLRVANVINSLFYLFLDGQ